MTEHLAGLLLRLCEAGEPSILWGRLAKPFLGREFDRLLARGVLTEQAPADEWDVCADCECGHDGRRIQKIDDKLIAACPLDHRSDTVLEPEDLRSFRIDADAIVREIATASRLGGKPGPVLPGVWHLMPPKRALFVVLAKRDLATPGLIAALQRVEKQPITLLGPAVPVAERLRFAEASIHHVSITEAICADGFALDQQKLMLSPSVAPRLTVFVQENRIVLDGKSLVLSAQNFKLMALLASELVEGSPVVSHAEIAGKLWAGEERESLIGDPVRNLRNALKKAFSKNVSGKKALAPHLIEAVAGMGYRLALDKSEVMIRP